MKFEVILENGKSRFLGINRGEESIGACTLVYDEQTKHHNGIMILEKVIEDRELNTLVKSFQDDFVNYDEEEMFIEVYYGLHYGLRCDEHPRIWEKLLG